MNSTFVFNLLDNDMLYDEIQSTIEPVPSPSSAPAIFVEAPEIEKEVKRLLREDYEAVSVKWEVITEEELSTNKGGEAR